MQIRKIVLTLFFIVLILLMLLHADISLSYTLNALNLWFQKMIPTLFPFMVLSGIMIRMNLSEDFSELIYPFAKYLFAISKNGIYCIIMGFLCGFPMGAKVISDLYERKKLSKQEATYLLSFCNNIGPIYFMGFVLPMIGIQANLSFYLFGMYGLPLLYGILLRHTFYKKKLLFLKEDKSFITTNLTGNTSSLLFCIDDAIVSGMKSITTLGGYMILFNLINLIPHTLFTRFPALFSNNQNTVLAAFNAVLEITDGIHRMGDTMPLFVLILLPFGGLSCIAQTYSMIRHTDLSITAYIIHKLILTSLTAFYYFFFLLSSS